MSRGLLIILTLVTSLCQGQFTTVEDSLEALLPLLHDRALADACNTIAEENIHADLTKLDRYAAKGDSLSARLAYAEGMLTAKITRSYAVYWHGRLAEANRLFQEQFRAAQRLNFTPGMYKALHGIYITSLRLGQIRKAYDCVQTALQIAKHLAPEQQVFYTVEWTDALRMYYLYLNEFTKTREILNENLAYAQQHHAGHRPLGLCLKALGEMEIIDGHFTLALDYLARAREHFRSLRDQHNYLSCLIITASVYGDAGDAKKAIALYRDLLAKTERLGYKIGIADISTELAELYVRQGKFASAITLELDALNLYSEMNRTTRLMSTRKDLGKTFVKLGNYPQAIAYFKQAAALAEENVPSESYFVLSELYVLLSHAFAEMQDRPEALRYAHKALSLSQPKETFSLLVAPLNNIAAIYLRFHLPDSAAIPLRRLTAGFNTIESKPEQAAYFNSLGEWNLQRNDYAQSLTAFRKALSLSHALHDVNNTMAATLGLSAVHKSLHQPKLALAYLEAHHAAKDSIYSMASANEITDIVVQYQKTEKEKENVLLKNQQLLQQAHLRMRSISVGLASAMLLLTAIVAVTLVRANKIKKQNNRILLEKNHEIAMRHEEIKAQNDAIEWQHEQLKQSLRNLKHMQAMLIHAEKMASLGQLTAGMAHEINNPVNFISNGVEGLVLQIDVLATLLGHYDNVVRYLPPEKQKAVALLKNELELADTLADIQSLKKLVTTGVERTTHIVRSLRTFSREGETTPSLTDLNEQLDTTLLLTQSEMRGRIELVKAYDPALPQVECNIGEINQVLMNVILNAVQAIEHKGTITLSTGTAASREKVWIEIADTGCGIPEEVKPHVFDPFFTTKEVGKGTGLGLAISATLVEKNRGEITLESTKGCGTRFKIIFPAGPDLRRRASI